MARRERSLHWRDRHLRFHEFDLAAAALLVDELIEDVKRWPTFIFWG